MASVEGAVPAQVPGSNQYWEHIKSKDRAYFIGRDPDGRMVWQCEGDCIEVGNLDWSGWRHIPGCTGWDWEPEKAEEYPQYWTTLASQSSGIAYIKRIDQSTLVSVCKDGTEIADSVIEWKTNRRTRLTEQEAIALLDKPAKTFPAYYIHCDPSHKWYVRATTRESLPDVHLADGSVVRSQADWDDIDSFVNSGAWLEVTEAEAIARIAVDKAPAEVWPKYYVCNINSPGYYRCDSEYQVWHIEPNATEKQHTPASTLRNKAIWTEVTEAEAKARVTKTIEPALSIEFVPVAPEMDWVVQDRVPARNNIDEWCWCKFGKLPEKWSSGFAGLSSTIMHGHVMWDDVLHLRCRRKDLPPVPAPPEETFPQWYILKDDEKRSWVPDWTVKRTGEETSIRYARDEAGELYATNEPWTGAPDCWERCSDAEAIVRMGTSQFPRVPSEPRRVPVKLWVTYRLNDEGGDWPVRATQADQTCQNWKEIKFDGNGAFIEVES